MERIGDLDGVGQHPVEHRPIRRRQIECRPLDPGPPLVVAVCEPSTGFAAVAAGHDVEELAEADIDDLGRPALHPEPALTAEQCVLESEGGDRVEPVRVVDQRRAAGFDGFRHRVSTTAKIISNLGNGEAMATDLHRRPACRASRERTPGRRNLRVLVGPCPPARRATPALLAPHEARRAAEHRQVHQHDHAGAVMPRRSAAARRPL